MNCWKKFVGSTALQIAADCSESSFKSCIAKRADVSICRTFFLCGDKYINSKPAEYDEKHLNVLTQ